MSVRALVTAFAIAFMPSLSIAQSTTGQEIRGAGASSCGQYIEDSDDKDISMLYTTWVLGFLSGVNVTNESIKRDMVMLPDSASIKAYLDKYCHDNPLESVARGTVHLFLELHARAK